MKTPIIALFYLLAPLALADDFNEGLDAENVVEREAIKIDQLKQVIIESFTCTDLRSDEALFMLCQMVAEKTNLELKIIITERRNPESLTRRMSHHRTKLDLSIKDTDAYSILHQILTLSHWHLDSGDLRKGVFNVKTMAKPQVD